MFLSVGPIFIEGVQKPEAEILGIFSTEVAPKWGFQIFFHSRFSGPFPGRIVHSRFRKSDQTIQNGFRSGPEIKTSGCLIMLACQCILMKESIKTVTPKKQYSKIDMYLHIFIVYRYIMYVSILSSQEIKLPNILLSVRK